MHACQRGSHPARRAVFHGGREIRPCPAAPNTVHGISRFCPARAPADFHGRREVRSCPAAPTTASLGSWRRCPGTRPRHSGRSPAASPWSPTRCTSCTAPHPAPSCSKRRPSRSTSPPPLTLLHTAAIKRFILLQLLTGVPEAFSNDLSDHQIGC